MTIDTHQRSFPRQGSSKSWILLKVRPPMTMESAQFANTLEPFGAPSPHVTRRRTTPETTESWLVLPSSCSTITSTIPTLSLLSLPRLRSQPKLGLLPKLQPLPVYQLQCSTDSETPASCLEMASLTV